MIVTRAGETFDVADFPNDDNGWFWDGFQDGTWEPESFDILDQCLTPESTFVDIGAWIGPLTLWASRRCARVISVEPDPVAGGVLYNNLERNGVEDKVCVCSSAIGREMGRGRLSAGGTYGNSMSRLGKTGVEVTVWDLPGLWDFYEIDNVGLVKIDIEGGEARLVDDADFLHQWPLLLAYHGPWMSPVDQQRVSEAFGCDANTFGQVFSK